MNVRMIQRLAALLALAAACACSQIPSDAQPAAVTAALKALTDDCTTVGGRPDAKDAVKRAELNGDGVPDFVLYAGWVVCVDAYSVFGDREKSLTVFAGDRKAGAVEAFIASVYDAKVEDSGGTAQLWLTTSAEECGRPRAEVFADEVFCDRAIAWGASAGRFEYAPVSTVRLIQ